MQIKLTQPHSLNHPQAARRARRLLPELVRSYSEIRDFRQHWQEADGAMEFSFSVHGYKVHGRMRLSPHRVEVVMETPGTSPILRLFRTLIEQRVRQHLEQMFPSVGERRR